MKKYTLDGYRRQANKPPFELEVDEGEALVIQPPTTETMLEVAGTTDLRRQLELLTGDQFDKLMEVIGDEQGAILKPLFADMSKHFGLGEAPASRT